MENKIKEEKDKLELFSLKSVNAEKRNVEKQIKTNFLSKTYTHLFKQTNKQIIN